MRAGASHYPQHTTADLPLFAAAPVAAARVAPAACTATAEALPAEVARLIGALADARGEGRAIKAEALAAAVFGGVVQDGAQGNNSGAVRRVRQLLALWMDRLPWPVAAGDRGYYRPDTQAEAEHYYASLVSRAGEIETRAWTFARLCRGAGWQIGPADPEHVRLAAHRGVLQGRVA